MVSNAPVTTELNSTSQLNQFERVERALKPETRPGLENRITVSAFIAIVAFFTVAAAWTASCNRATFSASEKRKLAPFPQVHKVKTDLPKFAQGFEKFYNDRFAFRLPLVSVRNFVLLKAFDSSGDSQVMAGRHGQFFYAVPQALSVQANLQPFSDTDLQLWARSIQTRKNFLAEHGIKYVFFIPPEKGSIYPESLPARLMVRPGATRLDQLQSYLREHTDVDFVDAKGTLLKAKSGPFPLYHKPDTHWNQWGSFLVTQELFRHMHRYFSNVDELSIFDYRVTTDYPFIGDLSKMLGLGHMFVERCMVVLLPHEKGHPEDGAKIAPVPDVWVPSFAWVNPDTSLPRVFVLRDSFFGYLTPFLAERASFSEMHWSHILTAPLVLPQKPDLVVDEMAERHLCFYVPDNSPEFTQTKPEPTPAANLLANFDKTFELKDASVQPTKNGLLVKLRWRNLSDQVLDHKIALFAMSRSGDVLAQREYSQDSIVRTVKAFSEWTDMIEIPDANKAGITQLGINIHTADGKNSLGSVARNSDWGTARVLLDLKDLEKKDAL